MRTLLICLSMVLVCSLAACGSKDSGEKAETAAPAGGAPPVDTTTGTGTAAITPETQAAVVDGLFLKPFFDDAGTQDAIQVKPGSTFSIHVWGETIEPYQTNAAAFRVQLPPGIRVIGTVESDTKRMSHGTHDFNYMVAFECTEPGRYRVVSYLCLVEPGSQGGVVEVLPGFQREDYTFIGFTTCDFVELVATGGTATIKVE